MSSAGRGTSMYHGLMILSARDRQVLDHLADFALLTEAQVRTLVFGSLASPTPCRRSLERLWKARLINRLDIRVVGSKGGAGEYIWKLAPAGLKLCRPGEPYRDKVLRFPHTLAIADLACELARLEQAGLLVVARRDCEPDSWTTIGAADLRPDLRADLDLPAGKRHYWFEVDLSSERAPQLTKKLELYAEGFSEAWRLGWSSFPLIVWIVPDAKRQGLLQRLIERLPADARGLFKVTTMDQLPILLVDN